MHFLAFPRAACAASGSGSTVFIRSIPLNMSGYALGFRPPVKRYLRCHFFPFGWDGTWFVAEWWVGHERGVQRGFGAGWAKRCAGWLEPAYSQHFQHPGVVGPALSYDLRLCFDKASHWILLQ
jgi:hypothetical protein